MDIFDLDGPKGSYKGRGSSDGEPETTGNFPLKQGLVVLRIGHEGDGRIDLMLVSVKTPSGGRTEGDRRATAPTTGTTGRVFGGLLGAARAAGSLANEIFGAGIWATEGLTGQFDNVIDILRIADDSNADLKPGDYQLEVKSEARWTCEFIQPNVGQSTRKLSDEDDEGAMDELVEPGVYVLSPMTSGKRPMIASIRHVGAGDFSIEAFSVDGTHHCEIHAEKGQFYVEDKPTDIRPGKEYILLAEADGEWSHEFTEGY